MNTISFYTQSNRLYNAFQHDNVRQISIKLAVTAVGAFAVHRLSGPTTLLLTGANLAVTALVCTKRCSKWLSPKTAALAFGVSIATFSLLGTGCLVSRIHSLLTSILQSIGQKEWQTAIDRLFLTTTLLGFFIPTLERCIEVSSGILYNESWKKNVTNFLSQIFQGTKTQVSLLSELFIPKSIITRKIEDTGYLFNPIIIDEHRKIFKQKIYSNGELNPDLKAQLTKDLEKLNELRICLTQPTSKEEDLTLYLEEQNKIEILFAQISTLADVSQIDKTNPDIKKIFDTICEFQKDFETIKEQFFQDCSEREDDSSLTLLETLPFRQDEWQAVADALSTPYSPALGWSLATMGLRTIDDLKKKNIIDPSNRKQSNKQILDNLLNYIENEKKQEGINASRNTIYHLLSNTQNTPSITQNQNRAQKTACVAFRCFQTLILLSCLMLSPRVAMAGVASGIILRCIPSHWRSKYNDLIENSRDGCGLLGIMQQTYILFAQRSLFTNTSFSQMSQAQFEKSGWQGRCRILSFEMGIHVLAQWFATSLLYLSYWKSGGSYAHPQFDPKILNTIGNGFVYFFQGAALGNEIADVASQKFSWLYHRFA